MRALTMAIRNGTFGRIASRSWFAVDAYDVGWFTDDLIPPTASAPPAAPRTPRKWAIGSMRLITGRRV